MDFFTAQHPFKWSMLSFQIKKAVSETTLGAKNLNQNWEIPSAVFVTPVALQTLQQFSRNLGVCQRRVHIFCRPRESVWPGCSWKALGSPTEVQRWQLRVTGRHCILFRSLQFVSVPAVAQLEVWSRGADLGEEVPLATVGAH